MSLQLPIHETLALQGGGSEIDAAGSDPSGRSFELPYTVGFDLLQDLGVPYASNGPWWLARSRLCRRSFVRLKI